MNRARAREILGELVNLKGAVAPSAAIRAELERGTFFLDGDGGIRLQQLIAFAYGTKIELTYYKQTGKYYSSGDFVSMRDTFHEMIEDVRFMQRAGRLPGLADGCREFVVVIQAGEPWGVSHLLQPHGGS